LLFVLVAGLIGLLVSALLVEVGFRLLWKLPPQFAMFDQAGLFVETSDGGVGFQPGFRGVLEIRRDVPTDVRINALGMRGDEFAAKRPGERRVLMLGDSTVWGFGVEQDDSLPVALERELASGGKGVAVGNGGVPGYGTKDSVMRMAWLDLRFEPDAFVFCSTLGNDAVDDMRIDVAVCGGLRFDGHLARLARESWRFRMAVDWRALLWFETWIFTNKPEWSPLTQVRPNAAEIRRMAGLPGAYPGYERAFAGLFLDVGDEETSWGDGAPPVIPRILTNVRDSLRRARQLADGRPILFVVLPTIWQIDEARRQQELKKFGFDPARFGRGTAQARWLAVAQELGIPAVDVTAALAEAEDAGSLFVDAGGHFNRRGAEIVAREVAAALAPLLE